MFNWKGFKASITTTEAIERKQKIERAAKDFATRFEGVMEELSRG